MKIKEQLIKMNACSDAVEWVGETSLKTAWAKCERGDWMLWLCSRIDIDRKLLVQAACGCAEPALKYVVDGDDRPRIAIATARLWCEGKATIDDVRTAAAAAYAADAVADYAAYAAYAAAAASAAAYSASAAADASTAAYSAAAVYAAADAAAVLKAQAKIIRKHIPFCVVEAAIKGDKMNDTNKRESK